MEKGQIFQQVVLEQLDIYMQKEKKKNLELYLASYTKLTQSE